MQTRTLLTPPAHSREIAAAVPGARLERLADGGHRLTLEQPEAVKRPLPGGLARVVGQALMSGA